MSSLVSAAAIYNEILTRGPELLGLFYRPFFYAHLGENIASPSSAFIRKAELPISAAIYRAWP